MDNIVTIIITGIIGVAAGFTIAKIIEKSNISNLIKNAKKEAASILKDANFEAENIKKDKILQAKEKFIELKSEHEQVILARDKKVAEVEKRVRDKESQVSNELAKAKKVNDDYEAKTVEYTSKIEVLEKKQAEVEKMHKSQLQQLEVISGLSADEAREQLIEGLKAEAKTQAMSQIQDTIEEAKLTAQQEAKKIIINTIQRVGTEEAVENCVSVFNIESDDVKGRIIGREGRNIRALEAATGVEIIVDDTPEAIILSCFDPVRREIARLSLHKLVTDGRIHPARIEEVVAKTAKQIDDEIIEVGKRTVIDLGIHGLHPELIKVVGRMKYRSSYGQNLLQHSREVSKLCGIMAAELGLNVKLAKRVRSPDEYAERHLGSDPNIPHSEITRKIEALAPDRSTEIVLYCAAGGRSGVAKMQLESLGYTRVRNAGGIEAARRERGCAAQAPADSNSIPCPGEKTQ